MAAAPPPPAPPPQPWGATINPPTREEPLDIDFELRECYRAATLLPDGRSRRGRKTKHNTATRRWIDTVGFPAIAMGKRPPAEDMAMLRLSPRQSLSGASLAARDAWSQKHGRDPRSKQQTEAERLGQQTLLAWARSNLASALTHMPTPDVGGRWPAAIVPRHRRCREAFATTRRRRRRR